MKRRSEIKDYKNNSTLDLEAIIDEYSGYLYKVISNMTSNDLLKEDIEEIISDTFFVLWKNREKLKDEKLLSPYIAGIAKNLVREKRRISKIVYDIEDYIDIMPDNNKMDMICEEREKIAIVEKCIKKMKQEDITIFNLYYYSAKKNKEIAKLLNVSEFSVKSRLFRIRKKIKKELEKGGYSFE